MHVGFERQLLVRQFQRIVEWEKPDQKIVEHDQEVPIPRFHIIVKWDAHLEYRVLSTRRQCNKRNAGAPQNPLAVHTAKILFDF